MKICNQLILVLAMFAGAISCSKYEEVPPPKGDLHNIDFVLPASPRLTDEERKQIEEQRAALQEAIKNK
ncbi:MAG: hypothetical protein P0Y53_19180 [Candidatus Pseudobacter hemicellulosilyticus]|uniref:Uncharacterized protein n=1 Tax=Candidatus Pseudobacter hemicellulosilyticus TaxID=3121375 RepID=A0AAJ5WPX4_9BACT|nr:MAG: hypothetical protein P0Y53_19180 [Pseudobacter sp.]